MVADYARAKYGDIFTKLGTDLPAFAAQLGAISTVSASDSLGEVVIVRNVNGSMQTFIVHMLRGFDGTWRIDSM